MKIREPDFDAERTDRCVHAHPGPQAYMEIIGIESGPLEIIGDRNERDCGDEKLEKQGEITGSKSRQDLRVKTSVEERFVRSGVCFGALAGTVVSSGIEPV